MQEEIEKGNLYFKEGKYYINFNEVELKEIIREVEIVLEKSVEEIDLSIALNLNSILIKDSNIKDISKLKYFINLDYFHLENLIIEYWVDLKYFRRIRTLNLINGGLKDLNFLSNLSDTVESLQLDNNQISDLRPITHLNELRILGLSSNQIEDLTPLREMEFIRELFLYNNNIKNLEGIENVKIFTLHVGSNPLTLEGIKVIEEMEYLNTLSLDRKIFDGIVFARYPNYIFVDYLEFIEEENND
ncbi:leucine-rich repeat domain-containing protein [Natronospora cellulosivora (SeqCode)]